MIELPQPTVVVCHDSGAANLILEEMRDNPDHTWRAVFEGPAERLWMAAGSPGGRLWKLENAIVNGESVLSGTGWASNLEHEARQLARAAGLPSVAVIDHWVNYAARFEREGQVVLPDEIWVVDEYAFRLAVESFPTITVRERANLYLKREIAAVRAIGAPRAGRVLFLGEPVRFTWPGQTQPSEMEALDYLVSHLDLLGLQGQPQLRLRPHPSEPPDKYDEWIARFPYLDIALERSGSLSRAIAEAEWVAGCETAAMVVALAAGRRAVSTLPPAAPRCRLPHENLIHLRDMVKLRSKPASSKPAK
jgi:hypothetical protein